MTTGLIEVPCALLRRHNLRAICALAIIALFAIVPADFGSGGAQLKAHHWPASCGGNGQRPCKFFEHVPSCKPGLVEVALTRCKPDEGLVENLKDDAKAVFDPNSDSTCGGLGQQACVTSCDSGLMLHVGRGACVQNQASLLKMAESTVLEVEPILTALGNTIIECGAETIVEGLNAKNKAQAEGVAQRLIDRNCISVLLEQAQAAGYNTVTVGYGQGWGAVIGAELEAGIAYDVGFEYFPSAFGMVGVDFGPQLEGTPAAVVVSVYKGNNQPGPNGFGGDAHGVTWGGKMAMGGGMALWWNYDGSFAGASVTIGSGIEFEAAYIRNTTSVYNPLEVAWNNRYGNGDGGTVTRPDYPPKPPVTRRRPRPQPLRPAPQPTNTDLAIDALANVRQAITDAALIEQERLARTSWIQVCNKAKVDGKKVKRLGYAFAYWAEGSRGGADGWLSEGWWHLKKGKCQRHMLPSDADGFGMDYTIMLMGKINAKDSETGARNYSGDGLMFCVRGASKLRAADQAECKGEYDLLVQGMPVEVSRGGIRFEFRNSGKEGEGHFDPNKYAPSN